MRKKSLEIFQSRIGIWNGITRKAIRVRIRMQGILVTVLCPLLQGSDQQVVLAARLLSAQYFPQVSQRYRLHLYRYASSHTKSEK